jgi:hypothetical protein
MMWQYLVASRTTTRVRAERTTIQRGRPTSTRASWTLPETVELDPKIDPKCSLQDGCVALGRQGWELVGVTSHAMGDRDASTETYTLFFKKPA